MVKSFWRCPEFSNRRQVGDLEKRMSLLNQKNDCSVFNFTGCRGGEGVSTIVVNLIRYLASAEGGKSVLLIDANFRHPVLHDALDQTLGKGLAEVLKGSAPWSDVVSGTQSGNIHFLSCGGSYEQMSGSMEQDKFMSVMGEIRKMYDFVIIDSPPLLTSSGSLTTAAVSDGTFLVIQSLATPKEVAERAEAVLKDNECFLVGALLNRITQVVPKWMYKLL